MTIKEIAKTAFLLSWGKARYPELSLDPYAQLWLNDDSRAFAEDFYKDLTPDAAFYSALRSCYVTTTLLNFARHYPTFNLLNIGAGITSYPFLLPDTVTTYEFDQQSTIDYKKAKLNDFYQQQLLPQRNIHFNIIDLNTRQGIQSVAELIQNQDSPCFVLMEGILTYLNYSVFEKLNTVFSHQLPNESQVIMHGLVKDSHNPNIINQKLDYMSQKLAFNFAECTFYNINDFTSISNLQLVEHMDFPILQQRYASHIHYDINKLIDEHFFLLQKTSYGELAH